MLFPLMLAILVPSCFPDKKVDRLSRIKETGHIIVISRNNAHCWYTYRGESMGFEYDLAKAFSGYLEVDLEVRTTPWVDMIDAVNKGEGDLIAASLTATPAREEQVDFSNEYLSVQQRVVLHEDNYTIKDVGDLNGKTILRGTLTRVKGGGF
jgi:membrane-bound lytic murein transglycosylase F